MICQLIVDMDGEGHCAMIQAALNTLGGVRNVITNAEAQVVVVEGSMQPSDVLSRLEGVGQHARLITATCSNVVEEGSFLVRDLVGPQPDNSAGERKLKQTPYATTLNFRRALFVASAAVAEFKAEESNGDKVSGAVRLVGLVAGPLDANKTEPWMHVDVKIDGLAPTTEYCVELHEYGDIRYSRGWPNGRSILLCAVPFAP